VLTALQPRNQSGPAKEREVERRERRFPPPSSSLTLLLSSETSGDSILDQAEGAGGELGKGVGGGEIG